MLTVRHDRCYRALFRPFFGHTLQHQPIRYHSDSIGVLMRIDCPRMYDFV